MSSNLIIESNKKDDLPFVAIGIIVWNGEDTIEQTLRSVLFQSYKNIAIYILDNQSSDNTVKIIQKYMLMDKRILLIEDCIKRNIVDAQYEIFKKYLSKYEYCMFACDDDVYDVDYITKLFTEITKTGASLVYSNHGLIDGDLKISISNRAPLYTLNSTQFRNSLAFLAYRNCVPIFFGIYRVDKLMPAMLQFKLIDKYGFDHENLMIFHLLLCNNISFVNENLFFYRKKERINLYFSRGYKFSTKSLKKYLFLNLHNWNLSIEMGRIISHSKTTNLQSLILYFVLILTFFHRTYLSSILMYLRRILHKLRLN